MGLVGCAAALAYSFGDWLGRGLGLAALLAGAALACLLAWREKLPDPLYSLLASASALRNSSAVIGTQ